jgi:hypothetical protein
MRLIGWLTLLLCLWSTGDLVVDLAFEVPASVTDLQTTAEEPDNAAEHVLMPSDRADNPSTHTIAAAPIALDMVASALIDNTALNNSLYCRPPRSSPVSASPIPLRI